MADAPDKDQQTEAPTAKRKTDAVKEGDVLASKELAIAIMMLAGTLWLIGLGGWFFSATKTLLKMAFRSTCPTRIGSIRLVL